MNEKETTLISEWKYRHKGTRLKQVVVKTEIGKSKKGKTIYMSETKHIPL